MRIHSYILLIDDDNITNFINKTLIKKHINCDKIEIFGNGAFAIEYLEEALKNKLDCAELIFLDLNMPVKDGFQFLEAFNGFDFPNKKDVIIIGLTTSTHPKDTEKLLEAGCKRVLQKPLTEQQLLDVIRDFINKESS